MKVVITTQVRENYGDADKPYWKFKGGSVYVVPNLTVEQVLKVKERGIPTLTALIETRNSGFEEYVIDWAILDDDAKVCDEWETPFNLFWEQGRWVAKRTEENGEYGYMRKEIASKTEQYDMMMGGERENYTAVYTLRDGRVMTYAQLDQFYREAA